MPALVLRLVGPGFQPPQELAARAVLVVRLDAIGDYILFRNTLGPLKAAPEFRDRPFFLLGNSAWRSVAEALDGSLFAAMHWVDVTRYSQSVWYRAQVTAQLARWRVQTLVHPTYSRTSWADRIVAGVAADEKIASAGDQVNLHRRDASGRVYQRLVAVDPRPVVFEYERNAGFARALGAVIADPVPVVDPSGLPVVDGLPSGPYVAFHMDASRPEKEWSLDGFFRVVARVLDSGASAVLLGQRRTQEGVDFAVLGPRVVDLRSRTSLLQAARVLSCAHGFVGNDSSLLHLALAVGVRNVVALASGQHFGRFVPYPPLPGRNCHFLFPPALMKRLNDRRTLELEYADGRFDDMKLIALDDVVRGIDTFLAPRGTP